MSNTAGLTPAAGTPEERPMMSRYRMAALAVARLAPPLGDFPAAGVQPVKGHRANWVAAGWPSVTRDVYVGRGADRCIQPAKFYPRAWAEVYALALGLPLSHVTAWAVQDTATD